MKNKILEFRRKRALSQSQLAKITGFTQQAISLWDKNKRGLCNRAAEQIVRRFRKRGEKVEYSELWSFEEFEEFEEKE